MRKDSKLCDVLHVLLHMADQQEAVTSGQLASMMQTNPVVVRRTLSGLRDQGLVGSAKGRAGGWTLTCDFSKVTLLDVYQAVGAPTIFALGARNPSSSCLVEKAVNEAISDSLAEAQSLLIQRFNTLSLEDLFRRFSRDMAAIRKSMEATL